MRKKMIILAFLSPVWLLAQEVPKLQPPTSPAASIMGLQPSVILAPKSYKALEASLFSSFMNNEGGFMVPNNFALEFTPYWTKDHGLTLADYLFPKGVDDQLIRSSSFSLASTSNFLLGDSSTSNALAVGYRTTLFVSNGADKRRLQSLEGHSKALQAITVKIIAAMEEQVNVRNVTDKNLLCQLIQPVAEEAVKESKLFSKADQQILVKEIILETKKIDLNPANTDSFLDSFNALVDEKLEGESAFNDYKRYIRERFGFSVDLAYAGLLSFPTNDFEYSFLTRQSIWVTPAYRFADKLSVFKVMGVFRHTWYNLDYYAQYFPLVKVYDKNFDYGLAINAGFDKFSMTFELAGRHSNSLVSAGLDSEGNQLYRKEKDKDIQYAGTFSYRLTDQIVLSYTLGSSFDPILNPESTLISLLAINLGFGSPPNPSIKP